MSRGQSASGRSPPPSPSSPPPPPPLSPPPPPLSPSPPLLPPPPPPPSPPLPPFLLPPPPPSPPPPPPNPFAHAAPPRTSSRRWWLPSTRSAPPPGHRLPAARAELLARAGRPDEALVAYDAAIERCANEAERAHLEERRTALPQRTTATGDNAPMRLFAALVPPRDVLDHVRSWWPRARRSGAGRRPPWVHPAGTHAGRPASGSAAAGARTPAAARTHGAAADLVPPVRMHVPIVKFGNLALADAARLVDALEVQASDWQSPRLHLHGGVALEPEGDDSVWVGLAWRRRRAERGRARREPGRAGAAAVRRPEGVPADAAARHDQRAHDGGLPRAAAGRARRLREPGLVADDHVAAHPDRPRARTSRRTSSTARSRSGPRSRTEVAVRGVGAAPPLAASWLRGRRRGQPSGSPSWRRFARTTVSRSVTGIGRCSR